MPDSIELAKMVIVGVFIPLGFFAGNWYLRAEKGYAQTAAADLIVAIVIFDAVVTVASQDFEPFLRAPVLVPLIRYWHFFIALVAGSLWVAITKWGEPAVARYYEAKTSYYKTSFPFGTFLACWMGVLALIAIHVGFFVIKQGGQHG
jgi:hypothetical protein